VEDINHKSPNFDKQLFIHHVAEVTPVGTRVIYAHSREINLWCWILIIQILNRQVLALGASDPDTSSQLRFRLTEPFQIRNKEGYLRDEVESEYFS